MRSMPPGPGTARRARRRRDRSGRLARAGTTCTPHPAGPVERTAVAGVVVARPGRRALVTRCHAVVAEDAAALKSPLAEAARRAVGVGATVGGNADVACGDTDSAPARRSRRRGLLAEAVLVRAAVRVDQALIHRRDSAPCLHARIRRTFQLRGTMERARVGHHAHHRRDAVHARDVSGRRIGSAPAIARAVPANSVSRPAIRVWAVARCAIRPGIATYVKRLAAGAEHGDERDQRETGAAGALHHGCHEQCTCPA